VSSCKHVDWLTSASIVCVREEDPREVVYELRLGGAGEPRRIYAGPPYQPIVGLRITQAGALLSTNDPRQHLHVLDIDSRSLRPVDADTLMDTHGGWTSDGSLVFGGQVWGRFKLYALRPDGSTGPIQEAPVAEIPLCVLGDVIIYGRFPDGEMSFTRSPPRVAKGEVALFRRTLSSAPVALGTTRGFIDLLCAGDRAPPCYLVERDDDAKVDSSRGGTPHRLVEWSPETGTRGRTVLRWLAATGWGLPALSPDGRLVARPRKDGQIELQPIDGGAPNVLPCEYCQGPKYPTWDPDRNLVTNGYPNNQTLVRVRPDGNFEVLMTSERLIMFKEPRVSPDGRTIAVLTREANPSSWWVPAEDMR